MLTTAKRTRRGVVPERADHGRIDRRTSGAGDRCPSRALRDTLRILAAFNAADGNRACVASASSSRVAAAAVNR